MRRGKYGNEVFISEPIQRAEMLRVPFSISSARVHELFIPFTMMRRDGKESPMYKYSELGVLFPQRNRIMFAKGLPRGSDRPLLNHSARRPPPLQRCRPKTGGGHRAVAGGVQNLAAGGYLGHNFGNSEERSKRAGDEAQPRVDASRSVLGVEQRARIISYVEEVPAPRTGWRAAWQFLLTTRSEVRAIYRIRRNLSGPRPKPACRSGRFTLT